MRVGIEVGGTFTDFVRIGPEGVRVVKVPSVPSSPDVGAFNALVKSGVAITEILDLAHGSTVATNAVLERKGFATALITTRGFRDVLALQRHNRTRIYDLEYQKPDPVVSRADSFEISERVLSDGTVLQPLDEQQVVETLIPALKQGGYEAVGVCLLNSYVNPAHEVALRDLIKAHLPDLHVTLSSEVTREFREYERASTVTVSAYVQPVIDRYIARFEDRLAEEGFSGRFSVMQSNGGRLPAQAIRDSAVTALLSGPAAGVMGAARQAARSGYGNLITLDIGGTSTDVCVVTDGKPELTNEFTIDGLPIRIPVVDINTVGAGGGSIVWVDDGGMLRVGPHSAGADPGPACYGRGGDKPTITDAHVIRQTIRPEAFLGGEMPIHPDASRAVFAPIAARFGMSVEQAADSAIELANANIVRAIQLISTERGKDPRDYVLVPYGGAGPLHAAQVAEDLGVGTIVVPPNAGVLSAYGLIASDFVQFESLTRRAPVDDNAGDLVREVFESMKARAVERFEHLALGGDVKLDFIADMRFVGQAFEVPVTLSEDDVRQVDRELISKMFGQAHEKIYFFGADSDKPIEFVSFRLGITAELGELPLLQEERSYRVPRGEIELFDRRRAWQGTLLSRSDLAEGETLSGPLLLEDPTSTLFVPAGWQAVTDDQQNLVLKRMA